MRLAHRTVKVVLLVLCALVVANELILRHSYHRRIKNRSPAQSIFYSDWVIDMNEWRVRGWIRREFTRFEYLDAFTRLDRQMQLLSQFHQKADLELLWYRAEKGFALRPGSEDDARLREIQCVLCRNLRDCIAGFYHTRAAEGVERLREELLHRKLAPEVRAAFEGYEERLGVSLLPPEPEKPEEEQGPAPGP